MRKRDRRERRVRNTLTVDLGAAQLQALDNCRQIIAGWARAAGQTHAIPKGRGAVVRIAVKLLALEMAGSRNPLQAALGIDLVRTQKGPQQ